MDKLTQAKQIYEGFTNLIKNKFDMADEEIENMQKFRYDICLACINRDPTYNTCKLCGCYLPAKTRSKETSCPSPEKFWTAIH